LGQFLALLSHFLLGLAPPGDVDVRDDDAALRAPERHDGRREPSHLGGQGATVLDAGLFGVPIAHGDDRLQSLARVRLAVGRGAAALVEVVGAHGGAVRVVIVLPGEVRPRPLDGDDDAISVDGRHPAVQRVLDQGALPDAAY
jgi:hypothetical protein